MTEREVLPETTVKLDLLLDEVRDTAHGQQDRGETIATLLQSAKALVELAESLARSAFEIKPEPLVTDRSAFFNKFDVEPRKRNQEEHVNPYIQQQLSRSIYQIRRLRDRVFFENDLFADPAWDILLDLVYAERDNKSVSVTSACMASCVPPTTALRWVSILENRGYIERVQDPLDGRRRYVMLSEKGRTTMNRFFAQLVRRQLL